MKTIALVITCFFGAVAVAENRPNILWIISEDASPHIGSYGETLIETPNLDRLAQEGIRFTRAYVTSPVCSPSRSALMLGMYPSSFGAHNHRSQRITGKGGGNTAYYDSYRLSASSLKLIPELFRDHGYFIANGGKSKTDFNFQPNGGFYDGNDWSKRNEGQPFFSKIQIAGGKNRKASIANPVSPDDVTLPPYYPDNAVMREDWAQYLNSWVAADQEVGRVLSRLEREGALENTAIFFITDHGISHLRGKQFLYEEGTQIPLIVRLPEAKMAGTVNNDLIAHIDIVHTSLKLAGIPQPEHSHAYDIFSDDPREYVISERDRCDETVDFIRSVTTERYKYIRNFMPHLPHLQPNQYKDGKEISKNARELHKQGTLPEYTARLLAPTRPFEELYDLQNDPYELKNLATDPDHAEQLALMRTTLRIHMVEHHDLGLIPEPILEEAGRLAGTKFDAYNGPDAREELSTILDVFDAWRDGDVDQLIASAKNGTDSERYWAITALGVLDESNHIVDVNENLNDAAPGVQVATALALGRLGEPKTAIAHLEPLVDHENLVLGMYAIRALELLGEDVYRDSRGVITRATNSDYDFTRRIANRMMSTINANH